MPTVRMPSRLAVRMTRQAISPRLATSSFEKMGRIVETKSAALPSGAHFAAKQIRRRGRRRGSALRFCGARRRCVVLCVVMMTNTSDIDALLSLHTSE